MPKGKKRCPKCEKDVGAACKSCVHCNHSFLDGIAKRKSEAAVVAEVRQLSRACFGVSSPARARSRRKKKNKKKNGRTRAGAEAESRARTPFSLRFLSSVRFCGAPVSCVVSPDLRTGGRGGGTHVLRALNTHARTCERAHISSVETDKKLESPRPRPRPFPRAPAEEGSVDAGIEGAAAEGVHEARRGGGGIGLGGPGDRGRGSCDCGGRVLKGRGRSRDERGRGYIYIDRGWPSRRRRGLADWRCGGRGGGRHSGGRRQRRQHSSSSSSSKGGSSSRSAARRCSRRPRPCSSSAHRAPRGRSGTTPCSSRFGRRSARQPQRMGLCCGGWSERAARLSGRAPSSARARSRTRGACSAKAR